MRQQQHQPLQYGQQVGVTLYKVKIRKEIDKLKKLGKFDEDALRDIKKRI